MANDLSNPVTGTQASHDGFFDHGASADSLFGGTVQLAQADGAAAAPAAPGQTIHVTAPQDAAGPVVIRVEVAPGSIVDLPQPFDAAAALAAKEGDGNLAIRVGDVTVILQGYVAAANDPDHPVTIEGADGKPIDVATILASTDPAIDIQTAAGPADAQGGQGADNTGAILAQLEGGNGLGGFNAVGSQDQTELGYSLIDNSLRQEFAQTLGASPVFGFSVGTISGSFAEGFLRDPAQTAELGSFANFMHEYQDAVENPGNPLFAGWADFQGTGATGGDFQEYLDQTRKTVTVDASFTSGTGDLVLTDIVHNVTSNGSDLTVEIRDNGHTMFVRREEATDQDTGNALVAVVHVTGPDANGEFTIETILINRLDHPDAGKDSMDIQVQFTVYDGPSPLQNQEEGEGTGQEGPQSPSIEGTFTASFADDVPILEKVVYHNQHEIIERKGVSDGSDIGKVDEDWLPGGNKDHDTNTTGDAAGGTCVTGCIKVNFGADGAALSDGASEKINDPDKHAFVLDTSAYTLNQTFPYGDTGLTSGGQPLVVLSVGPDHLTVGIADTKQQLVATEEGDTSGEPSGPTDPIPGHTIFTLTLNQTTGQFEFDLKGPLDHGTPSDAIFGDETGVSALVEATPAGGTEETIPLEFGVKAYDDDGDYVQAEINIDVNDDVPIARDDHDHVEKGSFDTIYGDVISAYGEDSKAGKDTQGGDGAVVIGVAAGELTADQSGGVGKVIHGTYGDLYMGGDGGKYTYTRNPGTPGGGDDHFTYTLKDGDGDTSTAVLTVHIDNACVTITLPDSPADTTVHESGLAERNGEPAGTDAAANSETTSGTITINAPDTIKTLEIGGTSLTLAELNDLGTTPVTVHDGTRGDLVLNHFDAASGKLDYTYNLLDNDLVSGDSTTASFDIKVKDLDGSEGDATLAIKIVDDAPVANCDEISAVAGRSADIQFILDVSGSMKDTFFNVPGSTYPDNGIGLERYAMAQMLSQNPEVQNVQIVLFSDHSSHSVWMTAADALAYIQNNANFTGGGATNYDLALTEAMGALGSPRPLPQGDQTLVYFFSDGDPNTPNHDAGIDGNGSGSNVSQAEWETFVNKNDITNVFTVGIGNISSGELAELTPIAYPNIDTPPANHEDNFINITSSTVTALVQSVDHLVSAPSGAVTGDVTANDVSGADDFGNGKLVSVNYEGNPQSFDSTHHQFTIDLGADRGTLVINDDGTYTYTPPAGGADGQPFYVEYTIQDGDGDTATSKLKIDLKVAPEVDLDANCAGNNGTASFVEDQPTPTLIAPAGLVSDDGTIGSMTVTLTNRPDGDATERLYLDPASVPSGLTATYANGVLTIIGSASAADYQSVLRSIVYENTSQNPNGTDRTVTVSVKDEESTPLTSITHIVTVSVTAVNDAPTADIAPTTFNVDEQTDLTLSGKIASTFNMVIGDVDAGSDQVTVTLTVTEGKLYVDAGNSHVDQVSGSGTSTVTIKGSVSEINNLLGGVDTGSGSAGYVKYNDDTDTPSGSVQLKLTVNDNGQNGIGGAKTAFDTATILVKDTNDKPVTDLNGGSSGSDNAASFIEQTAVLVSPAGTVKDDSGTIASMTVTLTNRPDGNAVESLGLNSAAATAASGLTVGYNSTTGVLTITGSASASVYQSILQGILYNNSSDTPNTTQRSVTVVVSDGSLSSTSHTISISVTPVNDAPTADIAPLTFTVNEQTDLTLSGKIASQFNMVIGDVDAGNDTVTVTLSVTQGKLTVSEGNSGADVYSGNGTSTVVIKGSVTEINNLLHEIDTGGGSAGNIKYNDDTDSPAGSVQLTLTVNDNGENGIGGAKSASDTATIIVVDVNDKPVTDLNGAGSGSDNTAKFIEQTPIQIAPSGTVQDDSGTISSMTVTLTNRPDGNSIESLAIASGSVPAGVTATYNATTGVLSFTGPASAAAYQSMLQAIVYNNTSDTPNTTQRSVTVVVSDGSLSSTSHTIAISVTPVNDAPVAHIEPPSFAATEQTSLILSGKISGTNIMSISDVDSGSDTMTVKLTVGEGVLNVSKGNSGVDTVTGSGTSTVTITGSVAEINNLLGGVDTGVGSAGVIEYLNTSDSPAANTLLTLYVNDNGNNGSGPNLDDSASVTINITATNDAPIACDDNVITNAGSTVFSIPEWTLVYNDTDVDSAHSKLDVLNGLTGVLNSSGGTATHSLDGVDAMGTVTFSDTGGNGGSFDYKVTDGSLTDTGHVTITQDTVGTLSGTSNDDIIIVGATGTTVDAGGGDDIVIGGAGKDRLDGGSGNDLIFGQGGDDTMIFGSGDKYDGGTGFDRIEVTGTGGTSVTYNAGTFLNVEMVDLGHDTDRSGSSHENSLALSAGDLVAGGAGSLGGHSIALYVIGDTNGTSSGRDNVDLTGFNMTAIATNVAFADGATGQSHNFDIFQGTGANVGVKVAVEHNLDVI
jgi:hypothetical protein